LFVNYTLDGATLQEQWTVDNIKNLRHIVAGFPNYDPTKRMYLYHPANTKDDGQPSIRWGEGQSKTIWGIDPDGGHTITASGTTLTLNLKVTKYTFDAVNLTAETDDTVSVVYNSGTECS